MGKENPYKIPMCCDLMNIFTLIISVVIICTGKCTIVKHFSGATD